MATPMRFINFKSNVSEFGFFRVLATSRQRLIISNIVLGILVYAFTFATSYFILERSVSVSLNLFIITLLMMAVLIVSYIQALLVGEFFFSNHWRERVILGDKEVEGTVKDHNAEFLIVVIALILVNVFTLNFMTHGFFGVYQEEGFFRSRLRSTDAEERKSALVKLADVTSFSLWENENLRALVRQHYNDSSAIVREHAAWNSGEMGDASAREALISLVNKDTNMGVKAAAALSLGKLGNSPEARKVLEDKLQKANESAEKIGLLRGLALMRSPLSGKPAWAFTRDEDETVSLYAYWVLRNGAPTGIREKLRERLKNPRSAKERCALLDTLKMVATEEDVIWSRRQFEKEEKEKGCEPLTWEDKNERLYYVLYSDSFRVKHMKIVANATGTKERSWFERLVADTSQSWRVREVALEIVKQIDKAKKR